MKLLMVITDGFEDIEAIGTLALLRRAQIDVTIAALNNNSARGRYDVKIDELENLSHLNYDSYDGLILPGGPEYLIEEKDPYFLKMVKDFAINGKLIAAICAAPTILGHLGLLKNKKYTCFTSMDEDFGGTYVDTYAITDSNIITGKSAAAVIDFAFEIIKKIKGEEFTNKVKESIYYRG